MKKFIKLILAIMLLQAGFLPVHGSSSAHFYANRTNNTPDGAGYIYVYRGGGDKGDSGNKGDKLVMPTNEQWKSSNDQFDAGEISMDNSGNDADGYKYIDNQNDGNSNTTKGALHMYFFAKPNSGYRFDGWYDNPGGTGSPLAGSVDHYPFPNKQYTGAPVKAPAKPNQNYSQDYYGNFNGSNYHAKSGSTYQNWMSRWNNGTVGATPPGAGEWEGAYYLRHVEILSNGDDKDITKYAKFSIIPRHFKFVGTGFGDVVYSAAGTSVSAATVESGDITSDISLSVTFDESKYNFTKWQWSVGENGTKNDITTTVSGGTATATYTFVANRGYSGDMVWIWPVLTEKVDYVADVTIDETTTSYDSWAEAFAAAKATGVSGAIITLKKDVSGLDAVQTVDRDMTLNLNGHTITGSVNNMFTVSAGNFTLCDNTPSSAGRIVQNVADATGTTYALTVASGATLTLTSGGITAIGVNNVANSTGSSRGVQIKSGGTLVMSGGVIQSQSTNNAYALWNIGTATISGGVCNARAVGASSAGTGKTAVAFRNEGTSTTVNGGTFIAAADSTTAYGIQHNKSSVTLTINDATVQSTTGRSGACALVYSSGKILVKGGKYKATTPVNRTSTNEIELQGGIYDNVGNLRACAATGYDCYELEIGTDYNAGYRFVIKGLDANPNVCKVITLSGTTYYSSLVDAFTFIEAHPNDMQSVVMTAFEYNFNVADDYTVPQQTAFVVPYGAGQTGAQTTPTDIRTWASLSQYHLLSLGAGVNITVNGTFTVGGQQFGTSSNNPGPGSVTGQYAVLDMSAGGTLTIANGANLYAYGFIKGSGDQSTAGTITIQNGGTVYENLVVNDMHGGGGTAACVNGTKGSNDYGLFPFNQYFIQNVEPRMTIEYGGIEKASYNIQSSQGGQMGMINVIGNASDYLFQMTSGSAITKWYDASRDYQCYEVRGGITMNGLTLDAGMATMASSSFILPITNNMDIRAVSGAVLDMPYSLKFLPGSKLTIDEGAIVDIHKEMYVYDYQDWDKYAISYAQTYGLTSAGKKIPWHTLRNVTSAAVLGNANIVINGQLRIKDSGALYTTSHGGNITSTGSGKIVFNVAGKSANKNLYECWSTYGKKSDGTALAQGETDKAAGQVQVGSFNLLKTWYIFGTPIVCNPAQLRNSNDTYTSTSGAVAGDLYQYCDGTWTKGGCTTFTVTWKSEDGNTTLETDAGLANGTATEFNGSTPSKAATDQYTYTFDGWTTAANGGGTFYADGSTPAVSGNATYYAHFTQTNRSYTVTLNPNSGTINAGNITSYTYGTGATLPTNVTRDGFDFGGWFDNEEFTGDAVTSISNTATGDKAYWAKWTASNVGFYVDIVDVDNTKKTLTLNVSGWATSGWPYDVNEVVYYRDEAKATAASSTHFRANNRTLTIPYTGVPGDNFTITIKNVSAKTVSNHTYVIPAAITSETELTTNQTKPLFVKGATLIVNASISAPNIYVGENAKLVVNEGNKLTVDNLYLRTRPNSSAELINNGTITGNVYYTRIIEDKSGYFQFGLPYTCTAADVAAIRLSDGADPKYATGSGWALRYYDEQSRAENGPGDNWKTLTASEQITGGVGYEMYSGVNYYREFYFPVTLADTKTVSVTRHGNNATNSGWNVCVSPLTSEYTQEAVPEGVTISMMESDGSFIEQTVPTSISPAQVFAHLASGTGKLSFAGETLAFIPDPSSAPRHRMAAYQEATQIQWIHLDIKEANGMGDQTSIYAHPVRYEQVFKPGVDVAKLSLTASRAIIYSSHAYGDMAFAGVADSLLESGVALTVYSPAAQELTFSLRDNNWLDRMESVWLIDNETGAKIDLLSSDYPYEAAEGTTRGRFFIQGQFKAPQVATELEPTSDSSLKGREIRKVIINQKMFIEVNGRLYDATGKEVKR